MIYLLSTKSTVIGVMFSWHWTRWWDPCHRLIFISIEIVVNLADKLNSGVLFYWRGGMVVAPRYRFCSGIRRETITDQIFISTPVKTGYFIVSFSRTSQGLFKKGSFSVSLSSRVEKKTDCFTEIQYRLYHCTYLDSYIRFVSLLVSLPLASVPLKYNPFPWLTSLKYYRTNTQIKR